LRKRLERFVGQRCIFTATFIRFGWVCKPGGHWIHYVLIENVQDERGRDITEHVWMPLRREDYISVRFQHGDRMIFEAEVNTYVKGGKHRRRIDYGLCRPTHVDHIEQFEAEQEA
jgi:hypothetical protein